jgi:hypothetical protein
MMVSFLARMVRRVAKVVCWGWREERRVIPLYSNSGEILDKSDTDCKNIFAIVHLENRKVRNLASYPSTLIVGNFWIKVSRITKIFSGVSQYEFTGAYYARAKPTIQFSTTDV